MLADQFLITLNDVTEESKPRNYLGLSSIGTSCHRKLQYDHYHAYKTKHSARMLRLFNVGHIAEKQMIMDLLNLGIAVVSEQKSITATAGHWKGHIDGIGLTSDLDRFLVEFKTHNDRSFKDLKKNGVKDSKPAHYAQMTSYMGYLELSRALYMAYNKNDSEYYLEWVDFDEEYFKELQRKEFEVISADTLLPRIGTGTKTWFECKFCSAKDVCFDKTFTEENCRTCKFVDVHDEGKWYCSKHKKDLPSNYQDGCEDFKMAEMFK